VVVRDVPGVNPVADPVQWYWTGHTVRSEPFATASESLAYLEWRASNYPLFHELMGLWGDHSEHTVLDYGCGPGNDLVGFLVHGRAREAIGMDVSTTALDLARRRLALHEIGAPYSLRYVSDTTPAVPLADNSVDFIYCEGVLHHVSHPAEILAEFRRVLRRGGEARIMVYNRDSLWFHRYVPYERQTVAGIDTDLPIEEAFRRSTDGPDCPISRVWAPDEFMDLCARAGFDVEFRGGYFAREELGMRRDTPSELAPEHRAFLDDLTDEPYPRFGGLPAGIGGVYWLRR
jgi:SAM-dependent methyltransferase